MPRNYDEMRKATDRDFVIHGETFTVTHGSVALVEQLDEMQETWITKTDAVSSKDAIEFVQNRLLLMVDDQNGASGRLKKLIDDGDASYSEILDASRWAYEMMTGLPTMPPAPSQPGRGRTATSSKAE